METQPKLVVEARFPAGRGRWRCLSWKHPTGSSCRSRAKSPRTRTAGRPCSRRPRDGRRSQGSQGRDRDRDRSSARPGPLCDIRGAPTASCRATHRHTSRASREERPMSIKVGDQAAGGQDSPSWVRAGRRLFRRASCSRARRSVLFAVPGAFTPTCSEQHLPGFVGLADDIKAKGVGPDRLHRRQRRVRSERLVEVARRRRHHHARGRERAISRGVGTGTRPWSVRIGHAFEALCDDRERRRGRIPRNRRQSSGAYQGYGGENS